jgi:hypothetical protein
MRSPPATFKAMPHKHHRQQNEMLDWLKVTVEAIFDLKLHVQIFDSYKCFRIPLKPQWPAALCQARLEQRVR